MTNIDHEIKIEASPEKVSQALLNLNELKAWHTARIEGRPGGVLSFNGTDKPAFLWKIIENEPHKLITWECMDGPGDSIGTKAIYSLSKTGDGRTLVELQHTSWPDQEGNFRKCNTLWGVLLHHLKTYVETGKQVPAIL